MKKITITVAFFAMTAAAMAQDIELPKPDTGNAFPVYKAFAQRRSQRKYADKELEPQQLSNLLWCADGISRPDGRRTAPSARNAQETDIYVFTKKGVYLYDPAKHALMVKLMEDRRDVLCTSNPFAAKAPVLLLLVANYDRMGGLPKESWEFYGAIDAGYISQNIYLHCTAENLSTVAMCAIDRDAISRLLRFNGKAIVVHPVAFPAE